jgi:hypothetical protein
MTAKKDPKQHVTFPPPSPRHKQLSEKIFQGPSIKKPARNEDARDDAPNDGPYQRGPRYDG